MARPRTTARRNWPEGLYQNTSGYFYWRDPADEKTYGLGYDKASAFAEARAATAKRAAEASRSLIDRMNESDMPSLKAWVDEWLERQAQTLAPKTIKNHRSAFRELLARCGHIKLNSVTPKMIADVLEEYVDSGRVRMANLIRASCIELFRAAEVRGHIGVGKNPVAAIKIKASKVARSRLSLEEFMRIHAAQKKQWGKRAMELALVTAQRRGDIAMMLTSDVTDEHLQVDQRKSGGQTMLGIPLTLRLDAVGWSLADVIAKCRTPGVPSDFLVHHRTGGASYPAGSSVDANTVTEAFAAARGKARIEVEAGRTPPTFHEIRSLAIRLYKEQYGEEFAQALAGHRNIKTTMLYADPRDTTAKRMLIPDPSNPRVLD